jgi:membrane fusion protein (multidrug efflux system)
MLNFTKYFFFFLTLPGLFLVSACGTKKMSDTKKDQSPPAIEGLILHPQYMENDLEVSGTLMATDETVLMPEISGRITQLNLKEGQRVKKGTLLVKLFDADLQAQLNKLNAQLKTAQATEQRQKDVLKVNGISQEEYDQSVTLVSSLQADIAEKNAQISKTEIRAPFDGIIGLKNVSEGAVVSAGTNLATIRNDNFMKIDFSVPESYAADINNMNLTFTIEGDTTIYSAKVTAAEESIDESTRNMHVRALVTGKEYASNNKSAHFYPGASATVHLALGARENAIMVPSQALIALARYKNIIVARNGKAEFVKVTTGTRTPSAVEITSGLKEGDTIVTTGIQFIRPGNVLKFSSLK